MRLFCVTKDKNIQKMIAEESERFQWATLLSENPEELERASEQFHPNVVVVDATQGVDVEWWKARDVSQWLLFFLVDEDEINEKTLIETCEAGADGFLPKQCLTPNLLASRLRSSFERWNRRPPELFYQNYNILLDGERHTARINDKILNLTQSEFRILKELLDAKEGAGVSRQQLTARLFSDPTQNGRSLDVHVCSLRKKLKAISMGISALRGVGYRLAA